MMPEETAGKRQLGPIGDKIIFENEFVRVWSLTLDPGKRQPWHQHLLPYLIVPLTEGENVMTFDDGRVRETHEKPGETIWREPGIPHELLNRSAWQYRNVLIEIKSGDKLA
jgi:beta-alanine degradation protein BauB